MSLVVRQNRPLVEEVSTWFAAVSRIWEADSLSVLDPVAEGPETGSDGPLVVATAIAATAAAAVRP